MVSEWFVHSKTWAGAHAISLPALPHPEKDGLRRPAWAEKCSSTAERLQTMLWTLFECVGGQAHLTQNSHSTVMPRLGFFPESHPVGLVGIGYVLLPSRTH